jgi:hypothetical protein
MNDANVLCHSRKTVVVVCFRSKNGVCFALEPKIALQAAFPTTFSYLLLLLLRQMPPLLELFIFCRIKSTVIAIAINSPLNTFSEKM